MWKNFDGRPYTREQLAAHIATADFSNWHRKDGSKGRPLYIVLHNTSDPTIKLWLSWSPQKRSDYIRNVEDYYENKLHWHAGPHFFVPPDENICAFGFSDLETCGTHASCFNSDSIGIEMVGEFNDEQFDQGSGALVRDNAIFLMALLHNKLGLEPEPYVYGKQGLHFHVECKKDDHDCPGKFVRKPDVVARINAKMAELRGIKAVHDAADVGKLPSVARQCTGIVATVFGGSADPNTSAYDNHFINDHEFGVALPFRFKGPRPKVLAAKGSKSVVCDIVDVGPWNRSDPYWDGSGRPRSETQRAHGQIADNGKVPTNDAGIDLTPGAAREIGLDGKGLVDWEFVGVPSTTPIPTPAPTPTPSTPDSILADLLRRMRQLEDALAGLKSAVERVPSPEADEKMPGPDLSASLRHLIELFKMINQQKETASTEPATPEADQLAKLLQLAKSIIQPQKDGAPPPLGQVNGALGETLGNLLNGKKTAIGFLGTLATEILSNVPPGSSLAPFLASITPAAGLSWLALPAFLGMSAWGVLGKLEKWTQGVKAASTQTSK